MIVFKTQNQSKMLCVSFFCRSLCSWTSGAADWSGVDQPPEAGAPNGAVTNVTRGQFVQPFYNKNMSDKVAQCATKWVLACTKKRVTFVVCNGFEDTHLF